MNEIIQPDLSGNDSDKIMELYRYVEDLRMETSAEISALRRRLASVTGALTGGETD